MRSLPGLFPDAEYACQPQHYKPRQPERTRQTQGVPPDQERRWDVFSAGQFKKGCHSMPMFWGHQADIQKKIELLSEFGFFKFRELDTEDTVQSARYVFAVGMSSAC